MNNSSKYDFSDVLPEASVASRIRSFSADIFVLLLTVTICHSLFGDNLLSLSGLSFITIFSFLYFVVFQKVFGFTPGLFLMRLRLVSTASDEQLNFVQLFKRNFVFWGSSGLTSLLIPFNKNKSGFHDLVGNTKIVFQDPMGEPAGYWRTKLILVLMMQMAFASLSYYWVQRSPFLTWKIAEELKSRNVAFDSLEGSWHTGFIITNLVVSPTASIENLKIKFDSPFKIVKSGSLLISEVSFSGVKNNSNLSTEDLILYLLNPQIISELATQAKVQWFNSVVVQSLLVQNSKLNLALNNLTFGDQLLSWSNLHVASSSFDLTSGPTSITRASIEMKNSIALKVLEIKDTKLKKPLDFQYFIAFTEGRIQSLYALGLSNKFKISKVTGKPFQLFTFSLNLTDYFETGFPGENLTLFSQSENLPLLLVAQPDNGFFTFGDLKFNFDAKIEGAPVTASHRGGDREYTIAFPRNLLLSALETQSQASLVSKKKERLESLISKIEFNEQLQHLTEVQQVRLARTLRYFGVSPREPATTAPSN